MRGWFLVQKTEKRVVIMNRSGSTTPLRPFLKLWNFSFEPGFRFRIDQKSYLKLWNSHLNPGSDERDSSDLRKTVIFFRCHERLKLLSTFSFVKNVPYRDCTRTVVTVHSWEGKKITRSSIENWTGDQNTISSIENRDSELKGKVLVVWNSGIWTRVQTGNFRA